MGPNLFVCNENWDYIMPHVAACAVTSCTHCVVHAFRQAGHPYVNVVRQKLLMDMLFAPAKLYLTKLTAHPKYKNCKPECAEKDSHCLEQ